MPHKCVKCEKIYESGDLALKKGCDCGARVFIFYNSQKKAASVPASEAKWIETELVGLAGVKDAPVSIDIENVKVLEKGVFEINVANLVKNPLIVKGEDGVYYVKLPAKKKKK